MANISDAHFFGASFPEADFSETTVHVTDFRFTNLQGAVFRNAKILRVDLEGADIRGTDLSGIDIGREGKQGANYCFLSQVSIQDEREKVFDEMFKSIKFANIYGIKNAPPGFEKWAIEHEAVSIEDGNEWNKLVDKPSYLLTDP